MGVTMKAVSTFLILAFACHSMALPSAKKDLKEDSDVESDNMNTIDAHEFVDDKEKIQEFVNNIMRSAQNENLMKAKLMVAAESPLEEIIEQHGVSPNDAKLIQTFAMAKFMEIQQLEAMLHRQEMIRYYEKNLEEGGEFNGEAQSDEEFAIQQQEENFSGNF